MLGFTFFGCLAANEHTNTHIVDVHIVVEDLCLDIIVGNDLDDRVGTVSLMVVLLWIDSDGRLALSKKAGDGLHRSTEIS